MYLPEVAIKINTPITTNEIIIILYDFLPELVIFLDLDFRINNITNMTANTIINLITLNLFKIIQY